MSEEIETSKIIATLISERIDEIWGAACDTVSGITNTFKSRLKSTYSTYIETLYKKHSAYKTLIYRETPHPLREFYEPLDLINKDSHLNSPGINALAALNRPILITGTGGCGKSTIMKALLLDTIITQKWIPIFIELRYLEDSNTSLLEHISQNMRLNKLNLPPEFIKAALVRGGYVVFLDGLDELSEENSSRISEEIQILSHLSPDNIYLVTSRPGKNFISWSSFVELKVAPLTLEKACTLTDRLQIDSQLKKRFIKDLRNGLFEKHASFFANPLLLCIMLLTYQDSASIPGELHNFYALAFDALYFRHDALKEGFRRPTQTKLPIDKCKTLLSAFSLVTYLKHKTVFTETEITDYLSKAIKLAGITVKLCDFLTDLISAFCMLLKEGTLYTFTHRSFQEYFAAVYLVYAREDQQKTICNQFINYARNDRALDLAHGMNPELIETLVIIPFLEDIRLKTKYRDTISNANFFRFLSLFWENIGIDKIDRGEDCIVLSVVHESKNEERLRNGVLLRFVQRRFATEFQKNINSESKKTAEKRLIAHLKEIQSNEVKISTVVRKQELVNDVFNSFGWAIADFKALMGLLVKLKLRHEQQIALFKDILKS